MRRIAAIVILALVPACGKTQRPAVPPPTGGPGPEVTAVSYSQDVWPILTVRCQVCHTTGSGAEQVPDMLMTDPTATYTSWFNVFARCNPNLYRVFPGDSAMSFVFDKISQPGPLCGFRMPLLGPPLEESEQNTIRDWIDQGARRN
jgi:hypothetical protein